MTQLKSMSMMLCDGKDGRFMHRYFKIHIQCSPLNPMTDIRCEWLRFRKHSLLEWLDTPMEFRADLERNAI
ncbi:hypothetical protein AO254_10335 [Pseudomonas syringae]|nr:hypothetical protein AO254_10335 [Pseudomonas syringae]POD51910.1 hypothetical protein BKM15_14785 [Pseudomonas syringae pv. syringae]